MSIIKAAGSGEVSTGFYPYSIDQSLRFEDGSSAYLNRTPSSAGNRKTWTWSAWVKRGNLGTWQTVFSAGTGSDHVAARFTDSTNLFQFYNYSSPSYNWKIDTVAVFRDASAFYHLVLQVDSTQATSTDRIKIYINGERQTLSGSYPSLNFDSDVNTTQPHKIGAGINNNFLFDGYLSSIHFIDGQALTPTSYGEAKDGTWIPKSYSGSYGTNGFRLEFNSNTNDTSGNSNNWTANNISAHDYVPDTPTNNFCTMNSIAKKSTVTLSEGNLKSFSNDPSIVANVEATFGISSGKWYFEASGRSGSNVGYPVIYLADATTRSFNNTNYTGNGCSAYGAPIVNGSLLTRVASLSLNSTSEVRQFAFDFDDGKMWIGKNGTWYNNSGTSFTNSTGPESGNNFNSNSGFTYDVGKLFSGHNDGSCAITFNFGQDSTFAGAITAGGNADDNGIGDFKYPVPNTFLALASANLPEPTIIDGSEHFNTVLYTGNNSTQSITGVGFQPDWVWLKSRNGVYDHTVYDVIRGATYKLPPNDTYAESADVDTLTSFDSDGFSVGDDAKVNAASGSMVSWNWKAGGSAGNNTAGSITSQVSANTDAKFSIVSYTGTGSAATVGHSLGVQPSMIIVKNRDTATWWDVYHGTLGGTKYLRLNSTSSQFTGSVVWNDTDPTSSVFSVGTVNDVNASGEDYIAYCFANSDTTKAGSYVGNGSADGPFIFTGGRVSWILIKNITDSGEDWEIHDATRDPFNVTTKRLKANTAGAEVTATFLDFVSNGVKIRSTGGGYNSSGKTFVYLAIMSTPQKHSNAR